MHTQRLFNVFTALSLLLTISVEVCGRDLRVGSDPDAPTIAAAIRIAQPGDTIHLEPGRVYRESAPFRGKHGEPNRPITLDGHGAVLEGSDPLNPEQWREVSPGLFACDDLLPQLSEAVLSRWFFLFDGKMQLMGRTSKGKRAPFKQPEELEPGEWTFVEDPTRAQPDSRRIDGTFLIRLAPERTLAEANIGVPVRSNGVQLSGENSHLVIRNITATHPHNDGFNIHGDCRNVLFEKIRALECGDDGISAHETAQYRVEGFISIGNSTGICDIGHSQTSYSRVFIADCVGVDLYFLDEGRYALRDAVVLSSAQQALVVTGRENGNSHLTLENVYLKRLQEPRLGRVALRATLDAKRCTFEGLEWDIRGEARWSDSLINGQPTEPNASGADLPMLQSLIPESHRPE